MRHGNLWSLGGVLLAVLMAPGCVCCFSTSRLPCVRDGHDDGGGDGEYSPPGLAPGVVEVFRIDSAGVASKVGCITATTSAEWWVLKQGTPYPVPIDPGESLRFDRVDLTPADTDHDGTVTWQELCASTYASGLTNPRIVRRINETVTPLGPCP